MSIRGGWVSRIFGFWNRGDGEHEVALVYGYGDEHVCCVLVPSRDV